MHYLLKPASLVPVEELVQDLYSQHGIEVTDARSYGLGFLIAHPPAVRHYAKLLYDPAQNKFVVGIQQGTYDVQTFAMFVENQLSLVAAWAADFNNAIGNPDHASS